VVENGRELGAHQLAELEQLYRESSNHALVFEALRYCAAYDCFPQWVASAVWTLLDQERHGTQQLQKWWRRREAQLKHLYRSMYFDEGRRRGLSRSQAAEYAVRALATTVAGGSVTNDAILASVKEVQKTDTRGTRRLTFIDWQWITRELPRSPAAVVREVNAAREAAGTKKAGK
jgi:hypothetical protein